MATGYLTQSYCYLRDGSSDTAFDWARLLCGDYLHAISSGNASLTINPYAEDHPSLLLNRLSSCMRDINQRNIRIGGNLRLSIAIRMVDIVSSSGPRSGWNARDYALCSLLECLPLSKSPDFKPNEETFPAIFRHINSTLAGLAKTLLELKGGEDDPASALLAMPNVFDCLECVLPEYGEVARGLPLPQLVEASNEYLVLLENYWTNVAHELSPYETMRLHCLKCQLRTFRLDGRCEPENTVSAATMADPDPGMVPMSMFVFLWTWSVTSVANPGHTSWPMAP
ncbi:hypothetical protein C8T65DRAFT_828930 [Cerioporus squamosus]|nr:hypothetical protein C8T65DRAFT_828930 [Cerioporus squamosus]